MQIVPRTWNDGGDAVRRGYGPVRGGSFRSEPWVARIFEARPILYGHSGARGEVAIVGPLRAAQAAPAYPLSEGAGGDDHGEQQRASAVVLFSGSESRSSECGRLMDVGVLPDALDHRAYPSSSRGRLFDKALHGRASRTG